MLDSAQLHPLLPADCRSLLDMGAGAGFPGLVLAILGVPEVHLVESDARKCAFLREAARLTGASSVQIHNTRLESLRLSRPADVVTARALAPLADLLDYAEPFIGSPTVCVFPKGHNVDVELTAAQQKWNMQVERFASRSDPSGLILRLSHVRRSPEA
jgi:16S rRNA (guanine527-N7)-methyltransferase